MIVVRILIDLLLAGGIFFAFSGVVGMLRMPDPFCRIQSATNISTVGLLLTAAAGFLNAALIEHSAQGAVKIVLIVVFVFLTNPVASHALSRAAYHHHEKIAHDAILTEDAYGRDMPHV